MLLSIAVGLQLQGLFLPPLVAPVMCNTRDSWMSLAVITDTAFKHCSRSTNTFISFICNLQGFFGSLCFLAAGNKTRFLSDKKKKGGGEDFSTNWMKGTM